MKNSLAILIVTLFSVQTSLAVQSPTIQPAERKKEELKPTAPLQIPSKAADSIQIETPIRVGGGEAKLITAKQANSTGRALIATEGALTGAALSRFSLAFNNGDHKIRQISVLQTEGKADAAFADQDSNDPFSFDAAWLKAGYPMASVTGVGGGEYELTLPSPPTGYVPVLGGFSFERKERSDANVRTIGVRLTPDNQRVRVTLIDDQGLDARGFENYVAAGFAMSMAPFGAVEASSVTAAVAAASLAEQEFSDKGLRNFSATVQIAWVPQESLLKCAAVSGSTRVIESGTAPAPDTCRSGVRIGGNTFCPPQAYGGGDKVALTGFLFHFGNSDHHLEKFAVDLKPNAGARSVEFQDSDEGDPIQWFVDYAAVK